MERIFVDGNLPVAIDLKQAKKTIKCTKYVMSSITALEYVEAQAKITGLQYIAISDIVAMLKLVELVDEAGNQYEPTYEDIAQTSSFNLIHFNEKKAELEAKVKAAN
ncbi:hypothetical protein [Acinetobacter baumannii]|uniref:hypothetical protein n=1 Tax=Acinetobacter baumannii TaxID=470 RepID=UPI000B12BCB8|nr:hypothetical protein [Acinetobacter baumannii]MCF4278115.1 hypothetical protein [Acinetobacter baumannii]MCF4286157.1 hypothetical protein [Acinetobacter baumannii]MCF4296622.1 hypothetical protein [Acinetobacter baumannii]MCF4393181.1 hypothetical protein [Acinetobacter baumannii]MCF4408619.1 hypothetical protein [Acinetobacter baumannii]